MTLPRVFTDKRCARYHASSCTLFCRAFLLGVKTKIFYRFEFAGNFFVKFGDDFKVLE
jgi:hypothetical protein